MYNKGREREKDVCVFVREGQTNRPETDRGRERERKVIAEKREDNNAN